MFVLIHTPGGHLSDSIGYLELAISGLSVVVISIVVLPEAGAFSLMTVTMALYGIGYGLPFPSKQLWLPTALRPINMGEPRVYFIP